MTDKDQALERAIKQEADTALAHLVFDERLKAAVRARVAQLEALPPATARTPAWRRWQPYAWSTLAAAALTGVVLMNSYRTGMLQAPSSGSTQMPTAAPSLQGGAAAAKSAAPAAPAPAPAPTPASELGSTSAPRDDVPPIAASAPQPSLMAIAQPEPVSVEIVPTAGSVVAGQPLSFTLRVTSNSENAAGLGATAPRLVIKSMGTQNLTSAQVPVPDLAGKQLAARGAQVTAHVVWNGTMTPGYYAVSLEGLTVAAGKESVSLSPGGQQILVRHPDGEALSKSLSPNRSTTAQDITMTVQTVDADAQATRVALRFEGVPGTVNNPSLTLRRDGGDVLVPLRTEQQQIPGGVMLRAEFNPLPAGTKSLSFTVTDLQVPGANNILTTVSGPWQVTVNP